MCKSVKDDSITINDIKNIKFNYTEYRWSFEFKFYMQNIIDENMDYKNIPIDEFPELKKWFDNKLNN